MLSITAEAEPWRAWIILRKLTDVGPDIDFWQAGEYAERIIVLTDHWTIRVIVEW